MRTPTAKRGTKMAEDNSTDDYKYDIALTVLHNDRQSAEAIKEELDDDLDVYLYTEHQEEIMARGNFMEVFPRTFRYDARLCVILYREGWGQEGSGTCSEKDAIRDRAQTEGISFLAIVQLEKDARPTWFPDSEGHIHYLKWGPKGTARLLEGRLERAASTDSPLRRVTRETADGASLPVSFYQRHLGGRYPAGYSTEVFMAAPELEVCDPCKRQVRFRPVIRVTVFDRADGISVEELLCPACAREREVPGIAPPAGMTEEELYSPHNPSVQDNVERLLKHEVLEMLNEDQDLPAKGVSHVGAYIGSAMSLMVSREHGDNHEIWIDLDELERQGALTRESFFVATKDLILSELEGPEAA